MPYLNSVHGLFLHLPFHQVHVRISPMTFHPVVSTGMLKSSILNGYKVSRTLKPGCSIIHMMLTLARLSYTPCTYVMDTDAERAEAWRLDSCSPHNDATGEKEDFARLCINGALSAVLPIVTVNPLQYKVIVRSTSVLERSAHKHMCNGALWRSSLHHANRLMGLT